MKKFKIILIILFLNHTLHCSANIMEYKITPFVTLKKKVKDSIIKVAKNYGYHKILQFPESAYLFYMDLVFIDDAGESFLYYRHGLKGQNLPIHQEIKAKGLTAYHGRDKQGDLYVIMTDLPGVKFKKIVKSLEDVINKNSKKQKLFSLQSLDLFPFDKAYAEIPQQESQTKISSNFCQEKDLLHPNIENQCLPSNDFNTAYGPLQKLLVPISKLICSSFVGQIGEGIASCLGGALKTIFNRVTVELPLYAKLAFSGYSQAASITLTAVNAIPDIIEGAQAAQRLLRGENAEGINVVGSLALQGLVWTGVGTGTNLVKGEIATTIGSKKATVAVNTKLRQVKKGESERLAADLEKRLESDKQREVKIQTKKDPGEVLKKVVGSIGVEGLMSALSKTSDIFKKVFEAIKKTLVEVMAPFQNLPAYIKERAICTMITDTAADTLLSVLTAGNYIPGFISKTAMKVQQIGKLSKFLNKLQEMPEIDLSYDSSKSNGQNQVTEERKKNFDKFSNLLEAVMAGRFPPPLMNMITNLMNRPNSEKMLQHYFNCFGYSMHNIDAIGEAGVGDYAFNLIRKRLKMRQARISPENRDKEYFENQKSCNEIQKTISTKEVKEAKENLKTLEERKENFEGQYSDTDKMDFASTILTIQDQLTLNKLEENQVISHTTAENILSKILDDHHTSLKKQIKSRKNKEKQVASEVSKSLGKLFEGRKSILDQQREKISKMFASSMSMEQKQDLYQDIDENSKLSENEKALLFTIIQQEQIRAQIREDEKAQVPESHISKQKEQLRDYNVQIEEALKKGKEAFLEEVKTVQALMDEYTKKEVKDKHKIATKIHQLNKYNQSNDKDKKKKVKELEKEIEQIKSEFAAQKTDRDEEIDRINSLWQSITARDPHILASKAFARLMTLSANRAWRILHEKFEDQLYDQKTKDLIDKHHGLFSKTWTGAGISLTQAQAGFLLKYAQTRVEEALEFETMASSLESNEP